MRKLADVSVDEFFKGDFEKTDEDSEDEEGIEEEEETLNIKTEKNASISESAEHRAALKSLEQKDPEFYKFLKESDKELLNFNVSSDSETEECHQPPESLEVASDDENYKKILEKKQMTIETLKRWKRKLNKTGSLPTLRLLVNAFLGIVEKAEGGNRDGPLVEDSGVFNGIITLCLTDFVPTVNRLLKIPLTAQKKGEFRPQKPRMWKRIEAPVKRYVSGVLKILSISSEPAVIKAFLQHVLQLIPYYTVTPKLSKALVKKLIVLWSTGEESIRVLALLCIVRFTRARQDKILEFVIKNMYMAYVKNTKFTSPSTWPTINFMKHSLVEVFALNESVAYEHSFVYIRQLAIHLRNAITVNKKDSIKAVYNWQFAHCLSLWSQLLCTLHPSAVLEPLLYPLVQTIIGTIKLFPVAKYIPLRFHCARLLINISGSTDTFIPVLPLLLEVLKLVDFNKKHTRISWKPIDFLCILKLSKSQLTENAFKDAVLDHFYELMISVLNTYAHTVAFPELVLPPIVELKAFIKSCNVANYCKPIKQLLDKMEENSRYIENKRKGYTGSLSDVKAVETFEHQLKLDTTPIGQYYASYRKLRDKEITSSSSLKDQLDDYNLPLIKRQELVKKQKEKDRVEFKDLFGDDSDDDDEIELKLRRETDSPDEEDKEEQEEDMEEESSNEEDNIIEERNARKQKAKQILEEIEEKYEKSSSNKKDSLEDLVLSSSENEDSDDENEDSE